MKRIAWLALAALVLAGAFSCGKAKKEVKWEFREIAGSEYARAGDEVDIRYPVVAEGESAEAINRRIESRLSSFFNDSDASVREAVDAQLRERNSDSMTLHIPYELTVDGEVYRYGKTASAVLYAYQYTGGAHGLPETIALVFDTTDGKPLGWKELFTDTVQLQKINREIFRDIHRDEPDFTASLFVAPENLPLPENAALDSAGLNVFYNVYEIAPYSTGGTEYRIPIEAIEGILNRRAID